MRRQQIIALLVLLFGFLSLIQAQDPQPQPQQPQEGEVIQIRDVIIDARIELPQVQILDKRKVSDFDEVKVEKSFKTELSGKNEEVRFSPVTSGKVKRIKNVTALINKRRF